MYNVVLFSVSSFVGRVEVHEYRVFECSCTTVKVQDVVVPCSGIKLLSEIKDLKLSLCQDHEVVVEVVGSVRWQSHVVLEELKCKCHESSRGREE